MIFLKFFSIFLTTGAALLQIGLEFKWHDKRTKKHKVVRTVLILLIIVGFLSISVLVIYDDHQSAIQVRTLTGLKESAEKAAKDSEERELKAMADRERIKTDLIELQNQIKPVIKIAIEKYPTLDLNSALIKIAEDVKTLQDKNAELQKKTKELAEKDYFHPLNSEVKRDIVKRLDDIITYINGRDIHISIFCLSGNTNRQKVAIQLSDILSDRGFKTNGPTPYSLFSSGAFPAVGITLNEADKDIVEKLVYALNPFLKVQFSLKLKNDIEKGKISIAFNGDPLFSEAGVVTFK